MTVLGAQPAVRFQQILEAALLKAYAAVRIVWNAPSETAAPLRIITTTLRTAGRVCSHPPTFPLGGAPGFFLQLKAIQ